MKTKFYLTLLTMLMSVQVVIAQQIIYGDQNETIIIDRESNPENHAVSYYKVDEAPNAFTTGNNLRIVCELSANGTNDHIVCSTVRPVRGWGTMVPNEENTAFSYEDEYHGEGANIYSVAFTDPFNGWAVGRMENYSISSGVVFHTVDGGKIWNLQFTSGTAMRLHSIGFTDAKNGRVDGLRKVGDFSFDVSLVTKDGGVTWIE